MDKSNIVSLLLNSGLDVIGMDNNYVYFYDPGCIFPAFDILLHYAWIVVLVFTGIMLFGWAILYIRKGVNLDSLFNNAKSLILIFTVLALVKPIVNVVYGDNLFARQCEKKHVSLVSIQELLDQRNKDLNVSDNHTLAETFSVIDSGVESVYEDESQTDIITENNSSYPNQSPVKYVESSKTTTVYINELGDKIQRSGGSVAWRNNNPGNIVKSDFALQNGAIGVTDKWAVFPDEQTGLKAITKLLRTKKYNNLSVADAIKRYAPVSDGNNPEQYSKHISKMTGLPATSIINDLNDTDLTRIARAIQQFEGWTPGIETIISKGN